MADEPSSVGCALKAISQASHYALVYSIRDLYRANVVIAKALLLLSESGDSTDPCSYGNSEGQDKHIVVDTTDKATVTNPGLAEFQSQPQNDNSSDVQMCKMWLGRPEDTLVNLARYWLQTDRSERAKIPIMIRRAIKSNSPDLLALLGKFVLKRKRLAKLRLS
jgi:hypothetical protein